MSDSEMLLNAMNEAKHSFCRDANKRKDAASARNMERPQLMNFCSGSASCSQRALELAGSQALYGTIRAALQAETGFCPHHSLPESRTVQIDKPALHLFYCQPAPNKFDIGPCRTG